MRVLYTIHFAYPVLSAALDLQSMYIFFFSVSLQGAHARPGVKEIELLDRMHESITW